ncbi:ribbon-helix-helix protein, CopG family [Microbacterium sp. A84]|uniref:ribbon-helix-helix protein, CopG family n=1 Tax=Microbacterium sp. A84 TaxID=3450715 RepID=UPI003F41B996
MRTTVILPDELYRQVKERARRDNRTMTSFLEEALRRALAENGEARPDFRLQAFRPAVGARGVQPGVDLNSNAALEDLMDADDFTVKSIRAQQAARA